MITLIMVLLFLGPTLAGDDTEQNFPNFRALSFGRTNKDYVQFTPSDMSPFTSSFTVCSWMKRLHDASGPIVLHYYPGQLIILANGNYNFVNKALDLTGKFPQAAQWFHYCLSWAAGGTQRVYINGVEIGSTSAVSYNLALGGTIALGNQVESSKKSQFIFGGQLYKLNLYSEELTSSEIREMSEAGLCSTIEEKYETRQLKWEQILTKQRYGNVTEFELLAECYMSDINYVKAKLNETETELRMTNKTLLDTETKLNSTEHELQEVSTTLNGTLSELTATRTQLNETQTELKERKIRLQETQTELKERETRLLETETELNSTEHELLTVSKTLNHTRSLLEEARKRETVSRWDVLYTPPYLNKLFTRQLYVQLVNSWDMMEKFIGVNVTVGLVEHFREHHEEHEICEEE